MSTLYRSDAEMNPQISTLKKLNNIRLFYRPSSSFRSWTLWGARCENVLYIFYNVLISVLLPSLWFLFLFARGHFRHCYLCLLHGNHVIGCVFHWSSLFITWWNNYLMTHNLHWHYSKTHVKTFLWNRSSLKIVNRSTILDPLWPVYWMRHWD